MVQCTAATGIGARNTLNGDYFPGLIDDVRIFDHALSDAEVMALHQGSGPLLRLDFEQPVMTDGALLPDSTNWGHHATLQTGTSDVANKAASGQVGAYALTFDGVDDQVNAGNSADFKLADRATIAAWIYPTANNNMPIMTKEGEYELYRFSDGTIDYVFANTTPGWNWVNTGVTAPLNAWTHVAVVYNLGVVQTFLNGTLVHTYTGAGSIGDVDPQRNDLLIGRRATNTTEHFAGADGRRAPLQRGPARRGDPLHVPGRLAPGHAGRQRRHRRSLRLDPPHPGRTGGLVPGGPAR